MTNSDEFIRALLCLLEDQMSDNLAGYRCIGFPNYWVGRLFDSEELYHLISDLIEEYK